MTTYILDNFIPVPASLMEFAEWMVKHPRHVGLTETPSGLISTVFLGIDHRFGGNGPPLVFETLVFGGNYDGEMRRYSTWREAYRGHQEMVSAVAPKLLTYTA